VVEAVDAGVQQAVLRALSLYSNAVLARGKIDLGERHEEAGIVQAVEKKGKYVSSIARIICRSENRLGRLKL
jgi:hypothetical protein